MSYDTMQLTRSEGIAIITLNRPDKRNAISIRMRQELISLLGELGNDPEVGVLIFSGAGPTFSAGFDLDEFKEPERFCELYETSARYHRELWHFPLPTIAAVNGPAMGGGFDLATLCDIRICSENARFGHPEIKFGAPPLYTPLRWIVGQGIARELCLTGRRIDAGEALRIGLVSEVVESADQICQRAVQIAAAILEAPKSSLQFVKRYLVDNSDKGFEESFQVEHDRAFKEIILK